MGRLSYLSALVLIGALALASGFSGCEVWDDMMSAVGPVTTAVVFEGVSADGGPVEGGGAEYPTTALMLDFSAGIAGLSAGGITLTPIGNANKTITKGALEGSGPSYPLYVSGVAVEGYMDVSVNKAGYAFTPPTKTVTVLDGDIPAPTEVFFIGLTADGTARVS